MVTSDRNRLNRSHTRLPGWLAPACLLMLTALTAGSARGVEIDARFQPFRVAEGQTATYTLRISGADTVPEVAPPEVDGLSLEPAGRGSERMITPQGVSRAVTLSYTAVASEPGSYTVPAFAVELDGERVMVPEASLTVTPNPLRLELELPREKLYLGEVVPVRLRLYVPEGQRVGSNMEHPVLETSTFVNGGFPESPRERTQQVGGQAFRTFTWETTLRPVKAGRQEILFRFELYVTARESIGRNLPSWGSFSFSRRQRVILYTDDAAYTVSPLPEEGRPENFSGAIGTFAFGTQSVEPERARAGELIELTVEVEGMGNFDSLEPPRLADAPGWRVFEPDRAFRGSDVFDFSGTATYTYSLVPQEAGKTATPPLGFSYFDPDEERYISLEAPGLPVEVFPAPGQPGPAPGQADSGPGERPGRQTTLAEELPLKVEPGSGPATLTPLFYRPGFYAAQLLPAAATAAALAVGRRQRRLREDAAYARERARRAAMRAALGRADAAAQRGDSPAFLDAALDALRNAAAGGRDLQPAALTRNELDELLRGAGVSQETLEDARALLAADEAARYGGGPVPADIGRLNQRLRAVTGELTRKR